MCSKSKLLRTCIISVSHLVVDDDDEEGDGQHLLMLSIWQALFKSLHVN